MKDEGRMVLVGRLPTHALGPESWYWGEIMNYRDGTSGFVANVLIEHDLPKGATVQMLRLVVLSKRGWRDRSGELVPVPEAA